MKLSAKLVELFPIRKVDTIDGIPNQDVIVETNEGYPKKVIVNLRGDFLKDLELTLGSILEMEVGLESEESNGKWQTTVVSNTAPISITREETSGTPKFTEIVLHQRMLNLLKVQMKRDEEEGW